MSSMSSLAPTHYCHSCNLSVRAVSADDLICPLCQGGFVEEISSEDPPPIPAAIHSNPTPAPAPATNPFPRPRVLPLTGQRHMFHLIQTMTALMQDPLGGADGGGSGAGNVEIFFDNGSGRRAFGNFGDYFFGAEFDHLLQQLAENDPNRYGTPPASKSAVDEMPSVKITDEHLGLESITCAVCKDDFVLGSEVRQMPCKHMYHSDCILPWLSQHNSCPVCRFELATDDADYNQARLSGASGGGVGSRGFGRALGGGYRFPFSPWFGSEASGSGGGEEYDSLRDVD